MSNRAAYFVERWVASHIRALPHLGTVENTQPRHYAQSCLVDAEKTGIQRREIESAVGDLEAYLGNAIKRAAPRSAINQLILRQR
jgi:hypothetical protein